MLIDWFTVAAQIINFLILIFLLKRFLYGPIIEAMNKRAVRIADQRRQAEEARHNADREAAALAEEKKDLITSKNKLLDDARKEVVKWQEESFEKLKKEISATRQEWLNGIEEEKQDFLERLKIRISRLVFNLSQKVLFDLADAELESKLIENFLEKLGKEEDILERDGGKFNNSSVIVQSGFELSESLKEKITEKLARLIAKERHVDFKVNQDLGFGIEMIAGDYKIEWNLSRYLQDIEKDVTRTLQIPSGAPNV